MSGTEEIRPIRVPIRVDLRRTQDRLQARLMTLECRLAADPENEAAWRDYVTALDVFLRLEDRLGHQDGNGRAVLTTKEMAERLGISVKTLLARKAKGQIKPSITHGKALSWRFEDAIK